MREFGGEAELFVFVGERGEKKKIESIDNFGIGLVDNHVFF